MSYRPPTKPPLQVELSPEDVERVKRQNLELLSSMHPVPNRLIEWLVKRKVGVK